MDKPRLRDDPRVGTVVSVVDGYSFRNWVKINNADSRVRTTVTYFHDDGKGHPHGHRPTHPN